MKTFKSILSFQKEFDTDAKCRAHLELELWDNKPVCPYCQSTKAYKISNTFRYKCGNLECKKSFSVTVGTVFENTKIPLTKWFLAMYILAVHSKGISSLQLATWLDVTQKTAWFLNHRIRLMLTDKAPKQLGNTVEADETYVGGKESNKHGSAQRARERRNEKELAKIWNEPHKGRSPFSDKTMVAGMVERGGKIVTKVIPDTKGETLKLFVRQNVKDGATLYTDEWGGYRRLAKFYTHDTVQHNIKEYVRGNVHTNTIEGFWSLLKRQINGIHHSVSPKHLQRYCNESSFRYNNRLLAQDERFQDAIKACGGRLKYEDLISA